MNSSVRLRTRTNQDKRKSLRLQRYRLNSKRNHRTVSLPALMFLQARKPSCEHESGGGRDLGEQMGIQSPRTLASF